MPQFSPRSSPPLPDQQAEHTPSPLLGHRTSRVQQYLHGHMGGRQESSQFNFFDSPEPTVQGTSKRRRTGDFDDTELPTPPDSDPFDSMPSETLGNPSGRRTFGHVAVNIEKPRMGDRLPPTSVSDGTAFLESEDETLHEADDDWDDFLATASSARSKQKAIFLYQPKDQARLKTLARDWSTMSDQQKSLYVKTADMRNVIWPASERASDEDIKHAAEHFNTVEKTRHYPYAFDAGGHLYSEYNRRYGYPDKHDDYRRAIRARPNTSSSRNVTERARREPRAVAVVASVETSHKRRKTSESHVKQELLPSLRTSEHMVLNGLDTLKHIGFYEQDQSTYKEDLQLKQELQRMIRQLGEVQQENERLRAQIPRGVNSTSTLNDPQSRVASRDAESTQDSALTTRKLPPFSQLPTQTGLDFNLDEDDADEAFDHTLQSLAASIALDQTKAEGSRSCNGINKDTQFHGPTEDEVSPGSRGKARQDVELPLRSRHQHCEDASSAFKRAQTLPPPSIWTRATTEQPTPHHLALARIPENQLRRFAVNTANLSTSNSCTTSSDKSTFAVSKLPSSRTTCTCINLHPDIVSGKFSMPGHRSIPGLTTTAFMENIRKIARCTGHPPVLTEWCQDMVREQGW